MSYIVFLLLLIALLPKLPKFQESSLMTKNEQPQKNTLPQLKNLKDHILSSMGNSYKMLSAILAFLILYRIGDNFINTMINPFLLELNFSTAQIATTGKLCASIGTIIGGLIGSYYMTKRSIIDSLLFFGIIHTSAHLLLALLAVCGNNMMLYFITSLSESVTGGMAMAAYIAFIASLCKGKYKATGQAFFNSTMGLSRSILPSISGLLANYCGWTTFFLIAFFISIPSLILLGKIRNKLQQLLW
jgi:PAT family beta-lactamase induction signal transducer AmpG